MKLFYSEKNQMRRSTFAAVYCVYDDEAWLRKSLDSVYSCCDKIFILISDKPWQGQCVDNTNTLRCIKQYSDFDQKIEITNGTWNNETDQRNAGLLLTEKQGFEYCFVVDADEIYDPVQLMNMMNYVSKYPHIECWHMTWDTYWKSPLFKIEPREPFKPVVFVRTGRVKFTENRSVGGNRHGMIPPEVGFCHHMSYARSDEQVKKKIATFSHAHQIKSHWFESVWKAWDANHLLPNLHPTHPSSYQMAVYQPFASLPSVLKDSLQVQASVANTTSIVIVTYNQLKFTKECIESIRMYTPEPHEIVFVDNGSSDGTVKWLRRIVKNNMKYKLVENRKNLGFPMGCNQGIKKASGEYILLLNNDVVVTKGWLSGMLECLNNGMDVGIVGPMTNNISGPQQVPIVGYNSMQELNGYAQEFRKRNRFRRIPQRRIVGFCILFRRELVDKIGMLDESFESGNFEDDDFCLRAALAGYRNLIAADVFVHHYGSVSFVGNKIDYRSTMSANRKIMEEKWTLSAQSAAGKELAVLKATEAAAELYHKGLPDKAVKTLIDCIKISPDAMQIYLELARIFIESKRFGEALEVVESMPESARDGLKYLQCLGYTKEGLGLDDEADTYADRMLSMDRSYAPAINLKGVLAYKKREKEAAEDCFKRALDLDPSYGEAYTNLGVLRWTAGKTDEALEYLSKGFNLSPTVPDHQTLYYSAVSSSGRYCDAEALLRNAAGLYPSNKNIAFLHIDTLIQQRKFRAAMTEIEDAMVTFGVDDGILGAALSVREKIGPLALAQGSSKKGTLSLCMIVKDEEEHLAKCLHSVRPVVDEMIVVDTGSNDRTKAIARVFGAQVFDHSWTGDFSAARNYSLSKATGDWILIMDADEVLSPLDFKELKGITGRKAPAAAAYSVVTRNYVNDVSMTGWNQNTGKYPEEAGRGWVPSTKVRLFTRSKDIAFCQPVHETVESSLLKAKVPIYSCDIVVHHYGKLAKERDLEKGDHYYRLGKEKLDADPKNRKALIELARQAQALGKHDEAIEIWTKLLDLARNSPAPEANMKLLPPSKPGLQSEAYLQLASACLRLDRLDDALAMAQKAMDFRPVPKEALQTYATCEILSGSIDKALAAINESLEMEPEYPPALLLLAIVSCLRGEIERMQEIFEILLNKQFNITPGLNGVARQLQLKAKIRESISILNAAIQYRIGDQETTQLLETVQKIIQA